ncbi:MAG: hypothetical protein VKJ06_02170, partial [Vampirovibrionales bacterium]|nr:hypothetical protein [Vampirovibrionales bacterium]
GRLKSIQIPRGITINAQSRTSPMLFKALNRCQWHKAVLSIREADANAQNTKLEQLLQPVLQEALAQQGVSGLKLPNIEKMTLSLKHQPGLHALEYALNVYPGQSPLALKPIATVEGQFKPQEKLEASAFRAAVTLPELLLDGVALQHALHIERGRLSLQHAEITGTLDAPTLNQAALQLKGLNAFAQGTRIHNGQASLRYTQPQPGKSKLEVLSFNAKLNNSPSQGQNHGQGQVFAQVLLAQQPGARQQHWQVKHGALQIKNLPAAVVSPFLKASEAQADISGLMNGDFKARDGVLSGWIKLEQAQLRRFNQTILEKLTLNATLTPAQTVSITANGSSRGGQLQAQGSGSLKTQRWQARLNAAQLDLAKTLSWIKTQAPPTLSGQLSSIQQQLPEGQAKVILTAQGKGAVLTQWHLDGQVNRANLVLNLPSGSKASFILSNALLDARSQSASSSLFTIRQATLSPKASPQSAITLSVSQPGPNIINLKFYSKPNTPLTPWLKALNISTPPNAHLSGKLSGQINHIQPQSRTPLSKAWGSIDFWLDHSQWAPAQAITAHAQAQLARSQINARLLSGQAQMPFGAVTNASGQLALALPSSLAQSTPEVSGVPAGSTSFKTSLVLEPQRASVLLGDAFGESPKLPPRIQSHIPLQIIANARWNSGAVAGEGDFKVLAPEQPKKEAQLPAPAKAQAKTQTEIAPTESPESPAIAAVGNGPEAIQHADAKEQTDATAQPQPRSDALLKDTAQPETPGPTVYKSILAGPIEWYQGDWRLGPVTLNHPGGQWQLVTVRNASSPDERLIRLWTAEAIDLQQLWPLPEDHDYHVASGKLGIDLTAFWQTKTNQVTAEGFLQLDDAAMPNLLLNHVSGQLALSPGHPALGPSPLLATLNQQNADLVQKNSEESPGKAPEKHEKPEKPEDSAKPQANAAQPEKPPANAAETLHEIAPEQADMIPLTAGHTLSINVTRFSLPGTDVTMRGEIVDWSQFPLSIEGAKIRGKRFREDVFERFVNNIWPNKVMVPLFNDLLGLHVDWKNPPPLPYEIKEADVALDEAIYQNVILTNIKSRLSLYASGFTELKALSLNAAGGKATGSISLEPRNKNFVTVALNLDDVKANALERTLAGSASHIFGDLSGTVRFTTQGETPEAQTQNANGAINVMIRNGRLPAVAQIEKLLTAANIVRGGLLGLNIGNVFRAISPFEANYFAELFGELYLSNGDLIMQQVVSDGENLDLAAAGKMALANGDGQLVINGAMSQDFRGSLGGVGSLSLNKLLGWIPGFNILPGRILRYVPGVGYVPGFGGTAKDINRFRVILDGNLGEDPPPVKSFAWVTVDDSSNTAAQTGQTNHQINTPR